MLVVRRRGKWPLAEVVNAILYVLKNGCVWRDLSGDLPPWGTVYWHFAQGEADGTWQRVSTCLNVSSRERAEKKPAPTAVIPDTQSVKNAATVTGQTGGFGAGKLVKGRKRLVLTHTLGNVLAGRVLPANATDGPAVVAFWDEVAVAHDLLGRVQVVFVDSSFNGVFREHLAQRYGIRVEKPAHVLVEKTNFCMHAGRWIIEHRFTKPAPPWTNGQVEHFNRTLKEATVKRNHYQTTEQLNEHLQAFLLAYNHAKRLKRLPGKTPHGPSIPLSLSVTLPNSPWDYTPSMLTKPAYGNF